MQNFIRATETDMCNLVCGLKPSLPSPPPTLLHLLVKSKKLFVGFSIQTNFKKGEHTIPSFYFFATFNGCILNTQFKNYTRLK